jgi:hypothetical protein
MLLYRDGPEDYWKIPCTNKGYAAIADLCIRLAQIGLASEHSLNYADAARRAIWLTRLGYYLAKYLYIVRRVIGRFSAH